MLKRNWSLILIILIALSLRIVGINNHPPGFTADEASNGYNAYSILKTGKDQYGNFLPLSFRSFGDYRPPLYGYLAVPFIALFGLNETATRAPSIIFGTLTVLLTYLISQKIFNNKKIALLAAFLLSISPWHILLSRMADLSTLSCFYLALGVYFLVSWVTKKNLNNLIFSSISFSLSAYSYHNARITGPILLILFGLLFRNKILKNRKQITLSLLIGLLIIVPLLYSFYQRPETLVRRAKYESIFHQGSVEIKLWNHQTLDPPNQIPILTRFLHNKPYYYFLEISKKYLQHLDLNYLFFTGDPHERFQTPGSGLLLLALLPFLFLGLVKTLSSKNKLAKFLGLWILASPLVATMGLFTPNSLHTLDQSVPVTIIISFGAFKTTSNFKRKKIIFTVLSFLLIVNFYQFIKGYFYEIPKSYQLSKNWFWGQKELAKEISILEPDYDSVYFIGGHFDIFLVFFKKYDPAKFQKQVEMDPEVDENGFERIASFDKYKFFTSLESLESLKNNEKKPKILFVSFEEEIPDSKIFGKKPEFKLIKKFTHGSGEAIFKLTESII